MNSHPGGAAHTRRMLELSGLRPGARILDLGAGAGEAVGLLRDLGYGADGLDLARRGGLEDVRDPADGEDGADEEGGAEGGLAAGEKHAPERGVADEADGEEHVLVRDDAAVVLDAVDLLRRVADGDGEEDEYGGEGELEGEMAVEDRHREAERDAEEGAARAGGEGGVAQAEAGGN